MHRIALLGCSILLSTTLLNCSSTSNTYIRTIGFNICNNIKSEIQEEIFVKEKTLYLTPEGQKDYYTRSRKKYILKVNETMINLPFLNPEKDFLCYYLYKSKTWVAFSDKEYNYIPLKQIPNIQFVDSIIVFNHHGNLKFSLDNVDISNIFIDRVYEKILFSSDNSNTFKVLYLNEKTPKEAKATSKDHTQIKDLIDNKISFSDTIKFDSILNCIKLVKLTRSNYGQSRIISMISPLSITEKVSKVNGTYTTTTLFKLDTKIIYTLNTDFDSSEEMIHPEMTLFDNGFLYFLTSSNLTGISSSSVKKVKPYLGLSDFPSLSK